MRRVAVAGFCVCVGLFAGLPSLAANQGTGARDGGGDPTVYVDITESSPGGLAGGSGRVSCDLFAVTGTLGGGVSVGAGAVVPSPVVGQVYWLICRNLESQEVSTRLITYSAASAPISPVVLAAHAYRELPLVFPMPLTAPRVFVGGSGGMGASVGDGVVAVVGIVGDGDGAAGSSRVGDG